MKPVVQRTNSITVPWWRTTPPHHLKDIHWRYWATQHGSGASHQCQQERDANRDGRVGIRRPTWLEGRERGPDTSRTGRM